MNIEGHPMRVPLRVSRHRKHFAGLVRPLAY